MSPSAASSDLREFVRFANEQLANPSELRTPEEVLDLWRVDHPDASDLADSVAAIRRALVQADRGEGIPLAEFDRTFRSRHSINDDA